jgi:hypothetical protein
MCLVEHATERTAKIYREQANRRKIANSEQAKVDSVVQIRARKNGRNLGEATLYERAKSIQSSL